MDERRRSAREWLATIADDGAVARLEPAGTSPYLARHGITATTDDGIVCGELTIDGQVFLAAAQEATFLGGSVGARHGMRLATLLRAARETCTPVILLLASGGVRLHEANPAEVALASALRELVATRAAGVPVLAVGIGDVFGGTSVLAAAATRLALLDGTRFGLSGPKVIATARGMAELDPGNPAAIDAIFGAAARQALHVADHVRAEAPAMRAWCIARAAAAVPFAEDVARMQRELAAWVRAGAHGDTAPPAEMSARGSVPKTLQQHDGRVVVPPFVGVVDAQGLVALDAQLLALPHSLRTVVLREDSQGHAVSVAAEHSVLSQYLAHHACTLGWLRSRGVRIVGVLEGTGHSAAFFASALQADALYVLPGAHVMAMPVEAVARVTGMAPVDLARWSEDDPVLGHAARHLVTLGAARAIDDIARAV
jgi:malonate decarboxylase beta subunit